MDFKIIIYVLVISVGTSLTLFGQELCDDNIDNDNDGYTDCFDAECPCYNPFDCNSNSYFQTVGLNGETILFETNIDDYTLEPLYSLSDSGLTNGINAIGINPVDQFMYGISSEGPSDPSQLIRVDAKGRVEVVGSIDGLFGNYSAGTFGPDGTYYVCGSNKPLYEIAVDKNDPDFLQSQLLGAQDPPYYEIADIAFSPIDQHIYGIESRSLGAYPNRTLYRINPETGFAEPLGNTSIPGGGYLGAFYFTPSGDAIVYSNDFGTMYVVDVTADPPIGVEVGSGGPTTRSNDGASNPFCLGLEKSGPASIVKGDTITYTITLYNTSGDTIYEVRLRDSLIHDLSVSSNLLNISNGLIFQNTIFKGLKSINATVEKIPPGVFSFTFKVHIPCDHLYKSFSNQASIEGYSQRPILSDDPNSTALQDPTRTELLEKVFVETFLDTSVCRNDEFIFKGQMIRDSGEYQIFNESCDTLFNLNVDILPADTIFNTIYLCQGDSINFNGVWLSREGSYRYTYTDSNQCQQVEHLELFVLSGATRTEDSLLCRGGEFLWRGQGIRDEGIYRDTVHLDSCFEIFHLDVSFRDYFILNQEAIICPGDSINFADQFIQQEGIYRDTIDATQACDTIIVLDLQILDRPDMPVLQTICDPPAHELEFTDLNSWSVFWDNGAQTAITSYFEEGVAGYELRNSDPDCIVMGEINLPPLPELTFSDILYDSTLASGSILNLELAIDPSEWTLAWSPPDRSGCSDCLSVNYTATQDFQLSLEAVHQTGCKYRFSAHYTVLEPLKVFIPNIFSPNGDGVNDIWTIYRSDDRNTKILEAALFDRWGNCIERWDSPELIQWDGKYKGKDCEEGVYTYVIHFQDSLDQIYRSRGTVTLVR